MAGRWPWWVQVSLMYVLARLVSACIFMAAAIHQGTNPWFPPAPDYWNFITIWDGRWYQEAVDNGYPSVLPVDANGVVAENAWAFYALFPLLAKGLSVITGLGTFPSLTVIAMVAGLAAVLVIYKLFREFAGRRTAMWGAIFVSTFPISPILQVPYAESLNLLLLAASLLLVVRRRYLAAIPAVVLMCLSRPAGVPFAAMVGLLLVWKLWQRFGPASQATRTAPVDGAKAESTPSLLSLAALVVASGLAALAWPAIAWAVTGDPAAYTRTETAWRGHDLVPFKPWFDTGRMLFGPVLGVLAPFVVTALFVLAMMSKPVRALGTELRLWCACYMGYLLVFLHPQTSTFRLLLPLFPLALGAALLSKSKAYRGTVVVMFLLLQIVWVVWLWAWAPLPGGGDYPP
ncbi:glycosyltransferase family 39 protein [Paenarthrobacter ilicis]|nr:glycosyltransferase family 39 protein [Paenarthrobacter ilicis]